MIDLLARYEAAKGDSEAQAKLMADFGYTNWGSVTCAVSRLRRFPEILGAMVAPTKMPDKAFSGMASDKLTIATGSKIETAMIINDMQCPYHDKVAVRLVMRFAEEYQPDYLLINGDPSDFYPLSNFDRNPERRIRLQGDLDATNNMFGGFRRAAPNAHSGEIPPQRASRYS